jgi:hypothetical protein
LKVFRDFLYAASIAKTVNTRQALCLDPDS